MKSEYTINVTRIMEHEIQVSWPSEISEQILHEILSAKRHIQNNLGNEIHDIVNGYHTLNIYFNPAINTVEDLLPKVRELVCDDIYGDDQHYKTWHIPVCYDLDFGIDLEEMAVTLKTEVAHIVQLHAMTTYTVYFLGFLPGFMYLGGLNEQMHVPRRRDPRSKVPKGAVAIGGSQTGVYPNECPAGWHIIGNTPLTMFDVNNESPCFVTPGDKIQFEAISSMEHSEWLEELKTGNFDYAKLLADV